MTVGSLVLLVIAGLIGATSLLMASFAGYCLGHDNDRRSFGWAYLGGFMLLNGALALASMA